MGGSKRLWCKGKVQMRKVGLECEWQERSHALFMLGRIQYCNVFFVLKV